MTTGTERDAPQADGASGAPRQGEQLQDAASGLMSQASRTAEAQASTTMTRVGDTLDQVASAVRDASGSLRETQPDIARLVDSAAQRLDDAAAYLREHRPAETMGQLQDVARRQPALVIGGGLAIGIALGRLLRTGTASTTDRWDAGSQRRRLTGGASAYGGTSVGGYDPGSPVGYGSATGGGYGSTEAGGYSTGYDVAGGSQFGVPTDLGTPVSDIGDIGAELEATDLATGDETTSDATTGRGER